MQDKPTARELLEAVAAFLSEEVVPAFEGRRRFHALVAANVAAIVAREIELGQASLDEECHALRRLLEVADAPSGAESRTSEALRLNRELCSRIAAGWADAEPLRSRVLDHLEGVVAAKLAIDNPRFDRTK